MNSILQRTKLFLVFILTQCAIASSAFAISNSCEYTGPPAPVKGELLTDFRVLAMNVWGQHDDNEAKCEARLRSIGEQIANSVPAFNIVGLTEVHPDYEFLTCDGRKLVEGLQINGEYTGNKARWGHPETAWYDYDGGTSLFSTTKFDWTPYDEHVYRYKPNLNPRTAHGFIFSRIYLKPGLAVDVYVTHINSTGSGSILSPKCDQHCKRGQLLQLAEGIHQRSADSGFPVLVMGDFNIGGPNPTANRCEGNRGYGDIMEVFRNPRDLWLEAHPNQAGATHSSQRIDFMFLLNDSYFTNSPYELTISSPEQVKIIDWNIPGFYLDYPIWKPGPFPVSDHFGIEATLELRRRLDWATIISTIE